MYVYVCMYTTASCAGGVERAADVCTLTTVTTRYVDTDSIDTRTSRLISLISIIISFSAFITIYTHIYIQCESKKSPLRFSDIFPKRLGIFNNFLHTYYTFLSTLAYKFLFRYL